MSKKFKLMFEEWEDKWDGIKGTIRTEPEGYYVADVNLDNTLEFGNIETNTRDINQARVERWWKNQDK